MALLSFKQFLTIVNEDIQQDVDKLMADISLIDTQISQRTQPLAARKAQLQKLLAIKQKQAQAQQTRASNTERGAPGEMTAGNQTTTPGSSGSQTPGGQPALK